MACWPYQREYSLEVDDQDGGHLLESAPYLGFSPHNIQIHISNLHFVKHLSLEHMFTIKQIGCRQYCGTLNKAR